MLKKNKDSKKSAKKEVELEEQEIRIFTLYGPVDEESIEKTITTMLALSYMGTDPMQLIISTNGGLATEMFALYDIMRNVRQDIDINTLGLGKIMSAGVLLLAAGTKGKRKIGKHCKVMIHGLKTEIGGYMGDLQNDFDELKSIEKIYIKALAKETNMSKAEIKSLFKEKRDIYLTAEEAVELGIADEVI
jgi:ATP-dependent Clp protease protease subunit